MNELRVRALGPAPRGLILLAGKDGHRYRNLDALGVEKAALVFPIEAGRGDYGVRQPVERDVVEDLVPGQLARGAGGSGESGKDRRRRLAVGVIVVQQPGGEPDR